MARKWDLSGVTGMLSPEGRIQVIWGYVWRGDTLLIVFDKPLVKKRVEYILYRKGRHVYYGLRNQKESELEEKWDEDATIQQMLLDAIVQGARFYVSDGRVFTEL